MQKITSSLLFIALISPSLAFGQITERPLGRAQAEILRNEPRNQMIRGSTTQTLPRELLHTSSTKQLGFCSQIEKAFITIDSKGTAGTEKRDEATKQQVNKKVETEKQIDILRTENEAKRKAQIAELMKRASTTEQKLVIEKFTTALEEALNKKNDAIDELLIAHRNEIDTSMGSRKVEVDKALTVLTASIEAAKAQAKADCANNVDGNTVRNNLKTAIEKAQRNFKDTLSSLEKSKNAIEISRQTKKAEIKKIDDTFKKSIDTARVDLKQTLTTKRTTTSSTSPRR